MAYAIGTIKSLELFRKQLNRILADIFGTTNDFTAVQAFPAAGITVGGLKVLSGAGSPAGVISAPVGSLYLRTDGGAATSLYVKEAGIGSSGWVAK